MSWLMVPVFLDALVLEALEVLVLEELEALVGSVWLEDQEGVGKLAQAAAPNDFVLPGKPPSRCFSPFEAKPRPKRWKRLRTGVMRLALWSLPSSLRKTGFLVLSPFLTALTLAEGSEAAYTQAPSLAMCHGCLLRSVQAV